MKLYSITYLVIALIDAPKIHTDVLWDLTFLFGTITILYFAAIFFFKNKLSAKSKKTSALKTELSPMISEFIFYDETGTKEEKSLYINLKVKVRDMLKNDFKRRTISEILLELRKDVSGAAQTRLFELFQDLDLHQDSYKKLKSWRWERISTGIRELTQMEVTDAHSFLTRFVNDKRTTIRKQAELAIVTLDPNSIGYFLDTTRNKISEWQQLKLIEILANKEDFIPPSFKAWLVSKNKYVVLFSLRLIKFYNQNDANASIVELVKHRDNQIKQEAIDCIKTFHLTSALPTLKKVFWNCAIDIKIAILDAISNLGTSNDIPFLESIEKKERNYSVTSKAFGVINAIVPGSILPTEGIADLSNSIIPEDINIEPRASENVLKELSNERVEKSNIELKISEDTVEQSLSEDFLVNDLPTPISAKDAILDGYDSSEKATDINAISPEFSLDFLPLVTVVQKNASIKNEIAKVEINDLEVNHENAHEKYEVNAEEAVTIDPKNIEVVTEMDFIPIVVSDKNSIEKKKDPKSLEVVFETVSSLTETREPLKEKPTSELEVFYEQIIPTPEEQEKAVQFIPVDFEEVLPEKLEVSFELEKQEKDEDKDLELEIIFNNGHPPLSIPEEDSEIVEIDFSKSEELPDEQMLSNIEVDCEIEQASTSSENDLPTWLLNEIANEDANYKNRSYLKIDGPTWEAKSSQMMNQIKDYIKKVPSHKEPNDDVSDIIQLLDDIEVFGDEREIPLLQELMLKEDKTQTKERIDGIMKRFMGDDIYGQGIQSFSAYSVFEELFRNCDTEAKLILLDEIVLIGDKKELRFLEELSKDEIKAISTKATASLKLLKERLDRVAAGTEKQDADAYERFITMMEINPPKSTQIKEPSYFKIDFELDSEEDTTLKNNGNAVTSFLPGFISKLIKKVNFF